MRLIQLFKTFIHKRKNNKQLNLLFNRIKHKLFIIESTFEEERNELSSFLQSLSSEKEFSFYEQSIQQKLKDINDFELEQDIINNEIEKFNYINILNNPLPFNMEDFSDTFAICKRLSKYSYFSSIYSEFVTNVTTIKNDLEIIKKQYCLSNLIDTLNINKGNNYITIDEINRIIKEKEHSNISEQCFYPKLLETDINSLIESNNKTYIEKAIEDSLFDNINGMSLDNEQRSSIVCKDKNNLVIAGAGSGKTLTICGKVKYLLERDKVDPKDILLLSYSNKSANDLSKKISKISNNLTVSTFHSLGLAILNKSSGYKMTVEEQFDAIIEKYFREEVYNRPKSLDKLLTYYAFFLSSFKKDSSYQYKGELFKELKTNDMKSLKDTLCELSSDGSDFKTIKKENVKSFEELAIANFYFLNGIKYTYEASYKKLTANEEKRQYTPDFYLDDYDIYHEHYGVGRDMKAHQFSQKESIEYEKSMIWKKNLHMQNKTTCLETYSYEFDDFSIFAKIEEQLKKLGVKFEPLDKKEVYNCLNSIYNGYSFKSFISLIKSFINLYKSRYENKETFKELRAEKWSTKFKELKVNMFLDIAEDIYDYYINYINKEGKIDFDTMILKSKSLLDQIEDFRYKYIIVDEFQDISFSRMTFLKKLISVGDANLFAVGDDWQSIYRFSGSDLDIFINFEKYFGDTKVSYITSTHRNSQELQNIVGPFIQKNPSQFKKHIVSNKTLVNPIKLVYYRDNKFNALLESFKQVSKINPEANILLLGRNNHDINEYLGKNLFFSNVNNDEQKLLKCTLYKNFKITFSTVHASKGLEEDFVIILNADDDKLGFPNKIEDDEILNILLSKKSSFEYSEERRLFYVALTRTRSFVFLIVNYDFPSMFVNEIKDKCEVITSSENFKEQEFYRCPHCKSGKLVLRNNPVNGTSFYGCTNYPYCEYKINDIKAVHNDIRCPECGDFLVLRQSKNYYFYGCHGYPKCKYNITIDTYKRRLQYNKNNNINCFNKN